MRTIINPENWDRKSNYLFFKDFLNPSFSVTSEVECGDLFAAAKEHKFSFFLAYAYAILKAANSIKELRYRYDENNNQIYLYDKLELLSPIQVNDEGKFFTVRLPFASDFVSFHQEAKEILANIPKENDPYNAELNPDTDKLGLILISATPKLYFTSITTTQKSRHGADYPLINVGKMVIREGRNVMPIAITANHGFVDGFHISLFFERIGENMKQIVSAY
ncbi:MAG: CatA-like O-acetyltransferase [Bacteroidales bacterium]